MAALDRLITVVYPDRQPDAVRQLRAFAAYYKVASERVSDNARPVRLRDGVLWVNTSTAAWANALSLESPQLLARLRARLPDVPIRRIVWKSGPLPQKPEQPREELYEEPLLPLAELPPQLARELARIADDDVRDAVAGAAAASLGRTRLPRRGRGRPDSD